MIRHEPNDPGSMPGGWWPVPNGPAGPLGTGARVDRWAGEPHLSGTEKAMYLRPVTERTDVRADDRALSPRLDVLDSDSPARRDDVTLVDAMRRGDERAVGELYDRHSAMVMGVAMAIVRDRSDAETVVLDTFTQAWRAAERFDAARGSVASWLLVLARSRALDLLRSAGRRAKLAPVSVDEAPAQALVAEDAPSDPSRAVEANERQQRVSAALGELPAAQREAIELAFFEGLSHTEVAERLGEPLGTVKTRIRLGMTKLRQLLRHLGEGAVP
jgi:RNA polymerase sigma-70 factor, ECF subfamily